MINKSAADCRFCWHLVYGAVLVWRNRGVLKIYFRSNPRW